MIKLITRDNRQLLLFFIVSCVLFMFILLANYVQIGGSAALDEHIVLAFRSAGDLADPIGARWVEEMMRDITALGGVGILVIFSLMILMYLLLDGYKKVALIFFISATTGIILSFSLKYGFTRARPDLVPHISYVYTSSFPSGHAMMSSLIYFTIAGMLSHLPFKRVVKTYFYSVALILTIAIGISRVYMGVHWPTDVIGGWLVGSGWALLTYFIIRYMKITHWIDESSHDN